MIPILNCADTVRCSIILSKFVRYSLRNRKKISCMGKRVKRELFLTEKEERTKKARNWFLLVVLSLLGSTAVVTFERGLEIWQHGGWVAIMVVTVICLPFFCAYPLFLWISGKRARKERKRITESGHFVYGKVVRITEEWARRPRYVEKMYRLEVEYDDGTAKKKWTSPRYKKNPRDYIDTEKEYKLYILGEKCCLEAVEAKKTKQ